MNKEELIEVLRQFDDKRVEELPEKTRNMFYAIMKIADERDELENIRKEAIRYMKSIENEPDADMYMEIGEYNEYKYLLNILNKGDKNE